MQDAGLAHVASPQTRRRVLRDPGSGAQYDRVRVWEMATEHEAPELWKEPGGGTRIRRSATCAAP